MQQWLLAKSVGWFGADWGPAFYDTASNLAFIVAIVLPLMACVAYLTLWERKVIGWIQIRIGPNRVGPFGLLQPVADGIKLMLKEMILPANASKGLFLLAPIVEHVWDESFEGLTNIVDVYVRQLRSKVDEPFERKLIHTLRGVGYYLSEEESL